MLVEINLLPRNNEKKTSNLILLLLFLVLFLAAAGIAYFWGNHYESKLAKADKQIAASQSLIDAEQAKAKDLETLDSVAILNDAVTWTDEYPINTVKLLRHFISLLPERGFVQFFSINETSSVQVKVQFDSSREAAFYLNSLTASDWILEAKLIAMTAVPEEGTSAEGEGKELSNSEYLPRYIAEYEVLINPEKVKRNSTEKSELQGDQS